MNDIIDLTQVRRMDKDAYLIYEGVVRGLNANKKEFILDTLLDMVQMVRGYE